MHFVVWTDSLLCLERCCPWVKGRCDRGAGVSHTVQVTVLPSSKMTTWIWLPWSHGFHVGWEASEPVLPQSLVCYLVIWSYLENAPGDFEHTANVFLPCSFKILLISPSISFWSVLIQSLLQFLCVRDNYYKRSHHETFCSLYNTKRMTGCGASHSC